MGRIKDNRIASIQGFRISVEESRFNYIVIPQYKFKLRWHTFRDLDNRPLREYVSIPRLHGSRLEFDAGVLEHRVSNIISECREWLEDYKKRSGCKAPIVELKVKESKRKATEIPKKKKTRIKCSICNRVMRMGTTKRRKEEIICVSCRIEKEMKEYKGDGFFVDDESKL